MEGFVALMLGLVILGTARVLWRERAPLLALVNGGRSVSRVSRSQPVAFMQEEPTMIMSRRSDRELAVRYQAIVRAHVARVESENAKLKAENDRLKMENAKLKQVTAGQRTGIREYLERERAGKNITRTTITKLLGKDSSLGFVVIGEEMERFDREVAAKSISKAQAQTQVAATL